MCVCVIIFVVWKRLISVQYTHTYYIESRYAAVWVWMGPHLRSHGVVEAADDRVQQAHVHLVPKVQQTHRLLCTERRYRRHPLRDGS